MDLQADARHLVGPQLPAGSFDAVFSNAALPWIPEAAAVMANVQCLLDKLLPRQRSSIKILLAKLE